MSTGQYSILSFLVPFAIRLIPELFSSYPIGFDTIAYYIPIMISRLALAASPTAYLGGTILLYLPLTAIYSLVGNAFLIMKIVPAFLLGFLGVSGYLVGKNFLEWRPNRAVLLSILLCGYFVTLRLSWDLHRNVLGLSFALFTLAFIEHRNVKLRYVIVPMSSVLAVMTHESAAVLVVVIAIASLSSNKRYLKLGNYVLFVPAAFLLIFQIYLRHDLLSSQVQQPGSSSDPGNFAYNIGFLLIAFWPLLPLVIAGAIRQVRRPFSIWLIVCLIFGFLPNTGLPTGAPYRWILILVVPMVVLFMQGATALYSAKSTWGRAMGRIAITGFLLLVIAFSGSYVSLNGLTRNYFDFVPQYRALMPVTMVESTISAQDIPSIVMITHWANRTLTNSSILILPFQLYGWYLAIISGDQGLNYKPTGQERNTDDTLSAIRPKTGPIAMYARNVDLYRPEDETKLANLALVATSSARVYVVWWTYDPNIANLPRSFSVVYTVGNLSVYALSRT